MTNVDASCSANDKIKLEPLFPIGTKISKQFDEGMYVGSVQRHILVEKEKKIYYRIKYDDSDFEDLSEMKFLISSKNKHPTVKMKYLIAPIQKYPTIHLLM